MTPWQEWKQRNLERQKQGIVTPMALFNPDTPETDEETQNKRLDICKKCPFYLATKQCLKCGCFMPAKTKLEYAACPEGKW